MFNCIIMGAAGRDFHDFRTFFRDHPEFRVCAFTASQIPYISARSYPKEMAGENYREDIPIHDEEELPGLITGLDIDFVFFAYSDLSHEEVMHRASMVQAAGASFVLLGPRHTSLRSSRKVVSITATRTGAGKSPLTQWLASSLVERGVRVATLRHPMPYGNLDKQAVQRFAEAADLDRHQCTIEEREEYEPYINRGLVIYAGVDYHAILSAAQREAEVILWDGGNNDFSFLRPDLTIVVADAMRAGHGQDYYPGETNFRAADILVINKISGAGTENVDRILSLAKDINPAAVIVQSDLDVVVDDPDAIRDKKVLIVEDGPTLTHGGMTYGAGWVAAGKYGVAEIVDPASSATGSIARTLADYPELKSVLPAMGYSPEQRTELKRTIETSEADVVINASPSNIAALLELTMPVVQVRYEFVQRQGPDLLDRVLETLDWRQ